MNDLKNIVNPYLSIGDLHNQGLDFIGQNLLSFEKIPNKTNILITLSSNFVSRTNIFGNVSLNNLEATASYAMDYVLLDKYPKGFTQEQLIYAKKAEAIFDSYENPFDNFDLINQEIDIQVKDVINSNLTENEQIPILSGLAVAKFSLYYWNEQISNPKSYWAQINDLQAIQNPNLKLNWPKINWGKVLKADVKGAIAGFIRDFLGANAALTGTITGAIANSAAELIVQIYDNYYGN